MVAKFGLTRFVFTPILSKIPAFCTILSFYLADGLCFLQAQLSAFCRKFARKKYLFAVFHTLFHVERKAINIQFAMRIYAKCRAFSTKTQRI